MLDIFLFRQFLEPFRVQWVKVVSILWFVRRFSLLSLLLSFILHFCRCVENYLFEWETVACPDSKSERRGESRVESNVNDLAISMKAKIEDGRIARWNMIFINSKILIRKIQVRYINSENFEVGNLNCESEFVLITSKADTPEGISISHKAFAAHRWAWGQRCVRRWICIWECLLLKAVFQSLVLLNYLLQNSHYFNFLTIYVF